MVTATKYRISVLIWPVLMLFILGSILAALHWYLSQDIAALSLSSISLPNLALAVLFQCLALVAVVWSWHLNLKRQNVEQLTLQKSIIMVGVSTIGKYTPGKLLGLIARGAVVYQHAGQSRPALISALIEQVALIHSAAILAITFYLANRYSMITALPAFMIMLPSIWWLASSENLLLKIVRKIRKDYPDVVGFRHSYPAACLSLLLMWILASAVLWFTVQAYDISATPAPAMVFLTAILAYLGGFVAFFAPAGLGIREGIIVSILGPVIGVSPAILISLLQRLITASIDILFGCFALLLYAKR